MKLNKILLCVLMIGMVGCGTRKATVNLSKTDVKEESKEISSGSSNTEYKSTGSQETNEQVAKTDEKQESRTTERFDSAGRVKERITELINSKSADNSKRSSVWGYDINTRVNTAYTNTIYRTITISTKDKQKATTTNRNGQFWMIGAVLCFAILCFGAYKVLTNR